MGGVTWVWDYEKNHINQYTSMKYTARTVLEGIPIPVDKTQLDNSDMPPSEYACEDTLALELTIYQNRGHMRGTMRQTKFAEASIIIRTLYATFFGMRV